MTRTLESLLKGIIGYKGEVSGTMVIATITDDSRRVMAGTLFIAIEGSQKNGLEFVRQAHQNGAIAIVSEAIAPEDLRSVWIQVPDARLARVILAQAFYGNPFAALKVHGITGTSGKTTTAYLMDAVLTAMGEKVALLGTICMRIGSELVPSQLTTPGIIDLYAFAADAVVAGCGHLVMEVSSHALDQGRIAGIAFDSCLFSNLSRDHLDYHKTFEDYYAAKKMLFTQYCRGISIVNVDDGYGARLAQELEDLGQNLTRVSRLGQSAEVVPTQLRTGEDGIDFQLDRLSAVPFHSRLCGEFNADNILLVCGWVLANQYSERSLRAALLDVQIPGRFEMVYNDGSRRVIVDYAHKPDALERVLATARSLCKRKLVVVFGCGGDRDQGKRPIMGQIAENVADMCFVTSDNPRTENAETILREIVAGMHKNSHAVIADRAQAIQVACRTLDAGDWLVVAGKGHEDYQIIGTTKQPFDDRKVVREAFGC